ncbi:hypothetical protein QUB70_13645 [Microcoleus sp. A003_D6]
MPVPQEKKFCGMGILPVLVIFARGLIKSSCSDRLKSMATRGRSPS